MYFQLKINFSHFLLAGNIGGEINAYMFPSHRYICESECWMFYAVPTGRVIFTAKTSLDGFILRHEQVFSDRIYEMRYLFVAVGLNARFIVLPHWDNMS